MKFLVEDNRQTHYYDRGKAWKAYKEKTKNRPRNAKVRRELIYRRIVDAVLKTVRENWVNSTGGVYVRHLGYFAVYRTPHKTLSHRDYFSYVDRLITDGYMYIPTHFTTLKTTDDMFGFNFNDSFPHRMTQELYSNLRAGRRYTLNYHIIKNYLKNRTNL